MRELWFAVFACIAAAVLSVDSATTAGSNGASTVNAAGTKQFGEALVNLLQTMSVGQRRLIVMQGLPAFAKSNVPLICNGTPAIVAYTPSLKNDECFRISDPTLDSNLSCTCLDYLKPTEWHFKIKQNTATQETALVKSQTTDDPIEIDSMMFYGIAPRVTTVTIEGQGSTPVSLTLMPSPLPGTDTSTVKLIHSSLETTVENLYIKNIDFKGMNLSRGFIPEVPSNLTITSCNVGGVKSDLISSLQNLENLDLSYNQLPWIYLDFNADACLSGGCPIVSLNLSHNRLTALPLNLMGMSKLKTLDLTANSITNLTVSTDQYDSIKKTLSTLKVDPIQTDCINGTIQTVATASVCVRNATTAAAPTPAPQDNKSNSYLMYAVIGGCLVIAVLVFALVKKNACKSREDVISTKEPLDAYFDNTLSYDETHATISASLLNDPIIITNRLPYKDLRVANCISKGGFGLVYSGVYNRRRVAIKKIRPDRAGDIKQIESFLKEICLIATLNHPRIVEFIGVSWDTLRNLCAVTEFMDRGDLREVLHGFKLRNTPLTWETHKTSISLNIAEGLTYLHSLSPKIVHRDLKSKNVLLNNEMVAKLSDFGISRERHIEETHMTAGIGTSFWIAPEVLLGKDYDERADIFSFGVVLSEIDTDDYPYWNASNPNVGNKAQENMILQMVASGAMRPSFSDTCPRAILELADLCLQVEPSNRPTAAEVAYKLQQIMQFMNPSSGSGKHVV